MTMITRVTAAALMLGATLAPIASAHEYNIGSLTIEYPWSRQTAPRAKTGAGYLTVINRERQDDRLMGGTTPVADRLEIHSMTMDRGIMRMRPVATGLPIPAGGKVELKPGGYHIMLIGLKAPLKKGDRIPAVLNFAKTGQVKVAFKVESIGASAPTAGKEAGGYGGHH